MRSKELLRFIALFEKLSAKDKECLINFLIHQQQISRKTKPSPFVRGIKS